MMQKLRETFEKVFGISFETLPIPNQPLQLICKNSLLLGSVEAMKYPFLIQSKFFQFHIHSPVNYFLVGFWGHGFNSYAFYYARNDGQNKICFRLPNGGVYMDNERAADIAKFLSSFFTFERKIKDHGLNLIAIESMGKGFYQIATSQGVQSEYTCSLLGTCNLEEFWESVCI